MLRRRVLGEKWELRANSSHPARTSIKNIDLQQVTLRKNSACKWKLVKGPEPKQILTCDHLQLFFENRKVLVDPLQVNFKLLELVSAFASHLRNWPLNPRKDNKSSYQRQVCAVTHAPVWGVGRGQSGGQGDFYVYKPLLFQSRGLKSCCLQNFRPRSCVTKNTDPRNFFPNGWFRVGFGFWIRHWRRVWTEMKLGQKLMLRRQQP